MITIVDISSSISIISIISGGTAGCYPADARGPPLPSAHLRGAGGLPSSSRASQTPPQRHRRRPSSQAETRKLQVADAEAIKPLQV